jgi:hypothetical protein
MSRTLCLTAVFVLAAGISLFAQEGRLQAEFRLEGEHVKGDCSSVKTVASCAATLVTDHPVHVTLGSIAPQNGFAVGPALVTHFTPSEQWRNTWSSDAVYATSGAWRAGTYFNAIHTHVELPTVVPSGTTTPRPIRITEYPIWSAYAQAISLPKLTFYGIGADSVRDNKTTYGLSELIVGGGGTLPLRNVVPALRPALFGDVNGRMFDVRSGEVSDTPQVAARFSGSSAPGLDASPSFVQFGEGARVRPALFNDRLQLGYTLQLQQFVSPQSEFSFRRWSVDLNHDVRLYHTNAPVMRRETNGPNECSVSPASHDCSPVTRDFWGTVGFRFFASKSQVGSDATVPFYLQRTLGGSDIDGNRTLASFADYRLRGPHLLLMQETFEHALGRLPIGAFVQGEQGKVASQGEGLDFQGLRHTTTFGVTLRAGGFPVVTASWSTGGREGNHFIVTMDTSLLGGGGRPSLQ